MALMLIADVSTQAGQAGRTRPAAGRAAGDAANGPTTYAKAGCEACYGSEGQGGRTAPRIAAVALPLPDFVAYVRKPTGVMPPHGAEAVSDQGLADIYAFLHSQAIGQAQRPGPARPQAQPAQTSRAAGPTPAGRVDAGAMLYRKTGCYQCHSNEGQGGAQGPRLGPDPIPFTRFLQYVRRPSGDMPPYTEKVLSDQDLADIYAFLQARPRPPAVNSIPQLAP